jgi:hypothetical protein
VRAGGIQDSLQNLDEFEPGARALILSRIPAESRAVLLNTVRSAWVSVEHDHFAVDAIVAHFGRARAIEYWRASFVRLLDRPLLRNFTAGMVNVLGRAPSVVAGFFVKGWPLAYRDCCEPAVDTVDGRPAIVFRDIAPELARYPNYFASWEGTCRGFGHVAQVASEVQFQVAPDQRSAIALISWR